MARILKKIRGYLDFYTSYSSRFFTRNYRKKFLHDIYIFEHFSVEFKEAHDYHLKS